MALELRGQAGRRGALSRARSRSGRGVVATGPTGAIVVSCWNATSYAVGELLPDPFDPIDTITQFVGESPAPGQYIPPNGIHLRGLYAGTGALVVPAQRELRGVSLWVAGARAPSMLAYGSNPNPADLPIGNLASCF